MAVNVGVHAARVGLQLRQLVGRQLGHGAISGGADLQVALATIMLDHAGPEYLGELPGRVPPQAVHLPEPVARGGVPLRKEEVGQVRRGNRRDALSVARDRYPVAQIGHLHRAIDLGQRRVDRMAQVQHDAHRAYRYQKEEG